MVKLVKPIAIALAVLLPHLVVAATPDQLRDRFIDEMVEKHGFDRKAVTRTLYQAITKRSILDAISRPAEKTLNWGEYRKIFIQPSRIAGGVAFWRKHADTLQRAEQEYGVPAQIIVAILGVETRYGGHTGGHRVLDALHTLGFHYPKRGKFFRAQLSEFLQFAREEKLNPLQLTGSYAGAMGMPQFMPDSFRTYAVDFDGDGKRDIWHNPADVIGSIANYFVKKGNWQRGEAVTTRASGVNGAHQHFIDAGAKPSLPAAKIRAAGVRTATPVDDDAKVSLMPFVTAEGTEHWVGLDNFYAIMRYNPRTKYAMAVYQLSEEINKAMEQQRAG